MVVAPKAHFAMKLGLKTRFSSHMRSEWNLQPVCGASVDATVYSDDRHEEPTPPFNIRAQAHYQGEPCRRCMKAAKRLGVAWPPVGIKGVGR
jgi:hypothetical protein